MKKRYNELPCMQNMMHMMRAARRTMIGACTGGWSCFLLLQFMPVGSLFCQPSDDPSPYSEAALIPEMEAVRPGEPFTVGLRIKLDPGWHSYWKNPGDAGQPALIDWSIPAGFRAGRILWPYPRVVEESTVVSYGYEDEFTLLIEIIPPRFMTTGYSVRFTAEARWLVCNKICLPASADLELELDLIDDQPLPSQRWVSLFADARERLPKRVDGWGMEASMFGDSIVLKIGSVELADRSFQGARFFASERGVIVHGAPQVVSQTSESAAVVLRRSPFLRAPFQRLTGVLVLPIPLDLEMGRTRSLVVDAQVLEP